LEKELHKEKKGNKELKKTMETLSCENKVFKEECDELYRKKVEKEE